MAFLPKPAVSKLIVNKVTPKMKNMITLMTLLPLAVFAEDNQISAGSIVLSWAPLWLLILIIWLVVRLIFRKLTSGNERMIESNERMAKSLEELVAILRKKD